MFVLRCFSLGFVLKFGLVCGGLTVGFMVWLILNFDDLRCLSA